MMLYAVMWVRAAGAAGLLALAFAGPGVVAVEVAAVVQPVSMSAPAATTAIAHRMFFMRKR